MADANHILMFDHVADAVWKLGPWVMSKKSSVVGALFPLGMTVDFEKNLLQSLFCQDLDLV